MGADWRSGQMFLRGWSAVETAVMSWSIYFTTNSFMCLMCLCKGFYFYIVQKICTFHYSTGIPPAFTSGYTMHFFPSNFYGVMYCIRDYVLNIVKTWGWCQEKTQYDKLIDPEMPRKLHIHLVTSVTCLCQHATREFTCLHTWYDTIHQVWGLWVLLPAQAWHGRPIRAERSSVTGGP